MIIPLSIKLDCFEVLLFQQAHSALKVVDFRLVWTDKETIMYVTSEFQYWAKSMEDQGKGIAPPCSTSIYE